MVASNLILVINITLKISNFFFMNKTPDYHSFNLNRKCNHCSTPIADQVHASTLFCAREELPDGSIKSCKDDYHAERYKQSNIRYKNIFNFHKRATDSISKLQAQKGGMVTIDDLDQYGIPLDRAAKIEIPPTQKSVFYFAEHCITQINATQFKITTHGLTFE
jgi:hypothetical protein